MRATLFNKLGLIAYQFVGAGVMAAMFALIMFEPAKFQFSMILFAPMIAILYCGIRVWPMIAITGQLPMFEESKTWEPSSQD
jgi:hypothetical protein